MNKSEATIEYTPTGRSGKAILTVRKGEKVLVNQRIDIANPQARNDFVSNLCQKHVHLKEEQDEINQRLLEIAAEVSRGLAAGGTVSDDASGEKDTEPLQKSQIALEQTDDELIECAREFLLLPDLAERIIEHVHLLGVAGEDELILNLYVLGTSRLMARPLAGIVMGASSAGKSYTINTVAWLFPPETVLQAHRMTPHALEYMAQGELVHRFVIAGERSRLQDDVGAEATRALREMLSDGKLSVAIPVKDGRSGQFHTEHIELDGPIAYVESTTLGVKDIFDEDRTRCLLLASDEAQAQTLAIMERLAQQASKPGSADTTDSAIALHHAAQRLLQPVAVQVPYAGDLPGCFPSDRLEVRRTFGHLLGLICGVALLHQFQRKRAPDGSIIATREDYEIVRQYMSGALARSLGCELTPGARQLLDVARTLYDFTVGKLAAQARCSENTARGRIKELLAVGQVELLEEARGRTPAKYGAATDPPPIHGLALPPLTIVEPQKQCAPTW